MAEKKVFKASEEAIAKSKQYRLFAILLWVLGVAAEIWAISLLLHPPVVMWQIIVLIVVDLAFVIPGSLLWKKSNKLNPPSEKQKLLFFMQSQLGLFTAIIAFLPLVIVILSNKNIDKKQKAILGSIAGVALVIAGITGYDFNPASVEKYTKQMNAQSELVQDLTGSDHVFWAPTGRVLHLYKDCPHLKNSESIGEGTVEDAYNKRNIHNNQICKTCAQRLAKEEGMDYQDIAKQIDATVDDR